MYVTVSLGTKKWEGSSCKVAITNLQFNTNERMIISIYINMLIYLKLFSILYIMRFMFYIDILSVLASLFIGCHMLLYVAL